MWHQHRIRGVPLSDLGPMTIEVSEGLDLMDEVHGQAGSVKTQSLLQDAMKSAFQRRR